MSTDERLSLTERVRRAAAPSLSDLVKKASRGPRESLLRVRLAQPRISRSLSNATAGEHEVHQRPSSPGIASRRHAPPPFRGKDVSDGRSATIVQEHRFMPIAERPHVFVVHGRDDAARLELTRFLEQVGFRALVLSEQAHKGQTIVEKIEACAPIDFAVVLMTPDDKCVDNTDIETWRARQNVLWEHAYFVAKLGRVRTSVLRKGDVEIPSDMQGLGWIDFDAGGAWKLDLGRELKHAGLPFDANAMI